MIPLAWWPAPVAAGTDVRSVSAATSSPRAPSSARSPPADGGEQQVVHRAAQRVAGAPQLVERFPDDGQPAGRPHLARQRRLRRARAQVGRRVAELPHQDPESAEPVPRERPGASQRRGLPAQPVADEVGVRRERKCRRNRHLRGRRVRGPVEQGPGQGHPGAPSAATWCTTTISANRSPGRPPTISARHNGRSSGRGRTIRSAAQVTRSAPTGRVAPSMCRSGSKAGSGAHTGIPSPNRVQTTRRRRASTRRARATSSRRTRGTSSVPSDRRKGRASNTPSRAIWKGVNRSATQALTSSSMRSRVSATPLTVLAARPAAPGDYVPMHCH